MKIKKVVIASILAISLSLNTFSSYRVQAASTENQQTLQQYKLAITTRLNEIEGNLNNRLTNQVGALYDARNISEYMMYWQIMYRNAEDLGFSDKELEYYGQRIIAYADNFNGKYSNTSEQYKSIELNIGDINTDVSLRYPNLMEYCMVNLSSTIPNYYEAVLDSIEADKPTNEEDKAIYLRTHSQVLEHLYKCIIVFQDVPITLTNLTPIQVGSTTPVAYSVNGSGDNSPLKNKITATVMEHEELLQYGKKVSQKSSDESLDVDLDETPIEMFTNIELDENGEYVFPGEVELSQAYLAMLAAGGVYTPFNSYVGSSEYTNALINLADDNTQGNMLVRAYNSVKDYRKPLYKRDIAADGSATGPAKLITIEDFIRDIEDGNSGALVAVQGDFHYNTEVQSWIYSQNELTYDYSIGTTVIPGEQNNDTKETIPTTEGHNETKASDLNVFNTVVANASELNSVICPEVDLTNDVSMINTIENIIFVGDSRISGLRNAMIDKGANITNLETTKHVYFVSQVGATYSWLSNFGINNVNNIINNNEGIKFTIVVNLGVNDVDNFKNYYTELNRLASADWSSCRVVFQSVGAVDDTNAKKAGSSVTNKLIESFNAEMKNNLNQNVQFVDITSDMYNSDKSGLKSGYAASSDGIHYTNQTSLKLLRNLLPSITDTNEQNTSSGTSETSESTAESTTEESSTSTTENTELVSDDLESAIYAYDSITDENYLTQPVLFYGTKYRRDKDNMTTAIMKNIISNTANMGAVENKSSRYLYINMFGDIVTDDNLVILPGIANPIIYKSDMKYNPYTVAFMNAYPNVTNRGLFFQVSAENDIGKYIFLSENINESIDDATIKCSLITSNSNIEDTNLLSCMPLESVFYTNTTDTNSILAGQRCVYDSVAIWKSSGLYNYNTIIQTYRPVINERLIFPYNYSEDTEYVIASVIARNLYEYIGYNRTDYTYDNNMSLNDNYLAHAFIISGSFGNKNPTAYSNDKLTEYKQFVATKNEQAKEHLVKFSSELINHMASTTGTIGMDSSFEDPILGNILRVLRENFILLVLIVLLVMLVAFLKYHRDLFEMILTSGVVVLLLALFVWVIPIYLPMLYNFVLDKTSTITAYKVLALTVDESRAKDNLSIQIDSDGNYKYNTASLTLYKISINELDDFYTRMNVEAKDVTGGNTSIINQEAGLFIEGDSLKVNIDILFDTLPITGRYTTVNGSYCWQLSADKTISNNLDYYVPYYYFVDNFIYKVNALAQVYDLPRSTTTYISGKNADNYLVYSYVNSAVFLTPGNYSLIEQEEAEEYMENYQEFVDESIELESYLTAMFGTNTDWLGIAPVFTTLSDEDKGTLWALTMQDNGYYDANWNPNEDKINDLIVYINNQTRDFIFDMEDAIGTISDETMIKLIALRAVTAFNQKVSQFKHWLYPFNIDYAEIELGDLLGAVFIDNYQRYVINDRDVASYVAEEHGWFVLVIFDFLVVMMYLVTNIIKIMVPVLYLLMMLVLFIRFISLGDVKIPMKGYLKVSGSLFISYTIFNISFWLFAQMNGSIWAIFLALLITALILYVILQTIFAVFMNILDFGDREITAKINSISDKLRIGDLFNNIRFNTVNLQHQKQSNVIPYTPKGNRRSRYSMDSSVDSIYNDSNLL